jgi:hypothetical protein
MVMLLVARVDLAASPAISGLGRSAISGLGRSATGRSATGRSALALAAAPVLVGAVLLVPIDAAMIRAQLGNVALDHGDAAAALDDFNAATVLHDLPVYRFGQALARASLGDLPGAADSLGRQDADEPFTFVAAERAFALPSDERESLLGRIEADGPYDATATLTAALLRFETDRVRATADLAAVMADIPPLVFSTRPPSLFDDGVWADAQHEAILSIGAIDPVTASAVATVAGLPNEVAALRGSVVGDHERRALDLLATAVATGSADLGEARALLREAPDSAPLQNVVWLLAFQVKSQPLIDDVSRLSVALSSTQPMPPMELVTNGRADADYSDRLPRYPAAASGRLGPKRPYLAGMVTIEPVYRPRP